jgi:hypothetical protein
MRTYKKAPKQEIAPTEKRIALKLAMILSYYALQDPIEAQAAKEASRLIERAYTRPLTYTEYSREYRAKRLTLGLCIESTCPFSHEPDIQRCGIHARYLVDKAAHLRTAVL